MALKSLDQLKNIRTPSNRVMNNPIKPYISRLARSITRILLKTPIASLLVRIIANDRDLLHSLAKDFTRKVDLLRAAQRASEDKFFCVDEKIIEQILAGAKLSVFDIGAAGNIEVGLKKYRQLLHVIAAEPRRDGTLIENTENFILVPKLIGNKEGRATLYITERETNSSVRRPPGKFLNLYISGNSPRFDCIDEASFPITTIASVLKETDRDVHYLKLDTNGNELDVLEGLGEYRPIIIKTEIGFVPIYQDQTIFFHLASVLYDLGYVLFHLGYVSKQSFDQSDEAFCETLIPVLGDAWFMPDWTRKIGRKIISTREKEYEALMLMFGMSEICDDVLKK